MGINNRPALNATPMSSESGRFQSKSAGSWHFWIVGNALAAESRFEDRGVRFFSPSLPISLGEPCRGRRWYRCESSGDQGALPSPDDVNRPSTGETKGRCPVPFSARRRIHEIGSGRRPNRRLILAMMSPSLYWAISVEESGMDAGSKQPGWVRSAPSFPSKNLGVGQLTPAVSFWWTIHTRGQFAEGCSHP